MVGYRLAPKAAMHAERFAQLALEVTSPKLEADYLATVAELQHYSALRRIARPAARTAVSLAVGMVTRSAAADYDIITGHDVWEAIKDILPGCGD